MPVVPHPQLLEFSTAILRATGLPEDQAIAIAGHLVEANLVGHDSHGVIRIPAYVQEYRKGARRPFGEHKMVRETLCSCVIDANRSVGIPMATFAMQWAVARAKQHTFGAAAVHHSGHIGRLGAYPPIAVGEDCIGAILLNGGKKFTAPFGGTARRLPPNPLAISVPTCAGSPLTLDMTTSVVAGGKVSFYRALGRPIPDDWLIGKDGERVTDVNTFFNNEGAMLPLGGSVGHKGFGLAVMIDAIAGGLSWAGCSAERPTRGGSGFIAIAINIESFVEVEVFKQEVSRLTDWIKSSPTVPGVDHIYMPGEIEEERRTERESVGVEVEDVTWSKILEVADELNVKAP